MNNPYPREIVDQDGAGIPVKNEKHILWQEGYDAKTEEVPEHLRDAVKRILWVGDQHVTVAIWCEEDVVGRAKEKGMKITREQAQEILAKMEKNHDAELGITWTTIDCYLEELEAYLSEMEATDYPPGTNAGGE